MMPTRDAGRLNHGPDGVLTAWFLRCEHCGAKQRSSKYGVYRTEQQGEPNSEAGYASKACNNKFRCIADELHTPVRPRDGSILP